MQAVDEARRGGGACLTINSARGFLGLGHDVNGVACRVDNRSRSHADFRSDVGVALEVGRPEGRRVGPEEAHLPELGTRGRVSVKGVDAVVFGRNKNHVASDTTYVEVGYPERLSVNKAVNWAGKKLPERGGVYG